MKPVLFWLARWVPTGLLVVLGGRAIAYALSPSPLALELSRQAGGPSLPLVTIVVGALGLALSAAVLWLAALGVRERQLLEARPVLSVPRLRLGLLLGRALLLWLSTMLTFALVESYIHWRAGLGWHGLHCLIGPVHRDAIPILGALSLLAAALIAACDHVLAWMRRVLAELRSSPRLAALVSAAHGAPLELALPPRFACALGARGPPTLS